MCTLQETCYIYCILSMKNMYLFFGELSACLLEEETNVATAKRLCTLLRRCSVKERAGISPVFCAVSIKVLQ